MRASDTVLVRADALCDCSESIEGQEHSVGYRSGCTDCGRMPLAVQIWGPESHNQGPGMLQR